MTATTGIYRDLQQSVHYPVFYTAHYSGLHTYGIETDLNLIINNDLAESRWKALPSLMTVTIPVDSERQRFFLRPSRIQAGRQMFLGPFEFSVLDGVQAPLYWSETAGIRLIAGLSHPTDLDDKEGGPIVGTEWFDRFLGVNTRVGYAARDTRFFDRRIWLIGTRDFSSLPWAPSLMAKAETGDTFKPSTQQMLSELTLNPMDRVFLSGLFSQRNPRRILADENYFLYRMFAKTAQRTWETTARIALTAEFSLNTHARWLSYGSGFKTEKGHQQEITLHWDRANTRIQAPSLTHTRSFGGDLWDVGVQWWNLLTDHIAINTGASASYFSKITNVTGWAYHARGGVEYRLGQSFLVAGWIEGERNPLFDFDTRGIVNVTFYR